MSDDLFTAAAISPCLCICHKYACIALFVNGEWWWWLFGFMTTMEARLEFGDYMVLCIPRWY